VVHRSSRVYYSGTNDKYNVGFIGLGQMGIRMAQNLLKGGKSLIAYDLSHEALTQINSSGAFIARSPKEIAESSRSIITMLPSSPHVQNVYLDTPSSLIHSLSKDHLCIDCSTIDPNVARTVSQRLKSLGVEMVDSPVSGGIVGAQNATLTFMVGGSDEGFQRAKPLLQLMGKNIVHCGSSGNGQVTKVCNNLLLGISMIGVSEAMQLGIQLGMDPKVLAGVLNTSSGRCWSSDSYNPVPGILPNVPASNEYKGGFAAELMAKDLGLAISAAQSSKTPLLLGGNAHQIYNMLVSRGYGGLDFSSIFKYLSECKK
jgi:3-hydroxyisobutyrate dehydrogenase